MGAVATAFTDAGAKEQIMDAIVGFVGGLLGAIIGAYLGFVLPRGSEKRKTAFSLIEKYNSSEMFLVRAVAWRVKNDWTRGDKSIMRSFVVSKDLIEHQKQSQLFPNGLTLDQNLAWFLHFFGNLAQYYKAGLVDKKLINLFFSQHYYSYRTFLLEFIDEFKTQARATNQPSPSWIIGVPQLEQIFTDWRDAQ